MLFLSIFTTIITIMVLALLGLSVKWMNDRKELDKTYARTMFVLALPMILGLATIWILYSNLG